MIWHSLNNSGSRRRQTFLASVLFIALISSASACTKRSHATPPVPASASAKTATTKTANQININTASLKELEALPGIGEGLAARIVEHREKYGRFRRIEHLMMVRGISDARFRALRHLVTVE